MKTDDDLVKTANHESPRGDEFITKLNYKPNYTDRNEYKDDQIFENNFKTDFQNSNRNRIGLLQKTRNEAKHGHKHSRTSNLHNISGSSIFSLSRDETIKSGEQKSECKFN